jgi:AI-2 transport system permease protein
MNFNRLKRSQEAVVLLILLGLVIIIGIINPDFLKASTLKGIVDSSLILIFIAIGEMFVVLTRGIDVSVGAIMGVSAVILGVALNAGIALPLSIILALVTGLLAGMVNGVGVTVFKVPPIIMTLGTLGAYRGLMLIITGGSWIETIPQNIKSMAGWTFLGVSVFAWGTLAIAIATTLLMKRIKQARYLYAVGDNEEGAYLAGIPVKTTRFWAYSLAGLFAGIAAVIFVAQIGFVPMQTGAGQELKAIAAVVLGGVNLTGGIGSPISALVGGLFLTTIDSVLIFLKVPAYWNNAIAGAILLIVVLIDFRIRQTLEARLRLARAQSRADNAAIAAKTAMEETS